MNRQSKITRRGQGGQAAIEFMACILVIFFFLFFYLSLSFLLVVSDYMEYATFMAARTYRAGFDQQSTNENNARTVFNGYTQKIQGVAQNFSINFPPIDARNNYTDGVVTSYEMNLFYMPPVFLGAGGAPVSRIRLTSEARLGREPGFNECFQYFQQFVGSSGVQGADNLVGNMDDNGC